MSDSNIHPVFDRMVSRKSREVKLNQHARVLWFTGLSGSGKTTLAIALEKQLFERGYFAQILDGDNIRSGINSNLGFSVEDRMENIRRIAEISKLFVSSGIITINCFVSPTEAMRQLARTIIGKDDYIEIYVDTPISICEQRDVKGLYAKARRGEIKDFTGIQSTFEDPSQANLTIKTENSSIESCLKEILNFVLPQIEHR